MNLRAEKDVIGCAEIFSAGTLSRVDRRRRGNVSYKAHLRSADSA
jgi:hypothetical protein